MTNILDTIKLRNVLSLIGREPDPPPVSGDVTSDMGNSQPRFPMNEIPDPIGPNLPNGPVGNMDARLPSPTGGGEDDLINQIRALFPPQHEATDKLEALLANQPSKEDYKPGFWRKLGGGLMTDSPDEADKFVNRKYYDKRREWGDQLAPLKELAISERSANNNDRYYANTMFQDEKNLREVASREKIAEDKNTVAREGLQQKDRYLSFKKYQHDNPNMVFKVDSEGQVYGVDPQSGATDYLTDSEGNFIKNDKLPEAARIKAETAAKLTEIKTKGAEDRATVGTRGAEDRKTDAAKPGGGSSSITNKGRTDAPSKQMFSRALAAKNKRPEWGSYITISPGDIFTITIPRGGNEETFKQIRDEIYGMTTELTGGIGGTIVPKDTPKEPPKGAKPGGTWKSSRFGNVYVEP